MAQIRVESGGNTLVVRLSGEIGATLVRPLRTTLEGMLGEHEARNVLVDMSDVTRCEAPVWAVMVATSRRLAWLGGRLYLTGVSAPVLAALRATGLHRMVSYQPAPAAAHAAADGVA